MEAENQTHKYFLLINQSDIEFVRAVEDHDAKEPTLLSFKKGSIIRIVRRKKQLSRGKISSDLGSCVVLNMRSRERERRTR